MRIISSFVMFCLLFLASGPVLAQNVNLTMYYPVAVGGPITKIIDNMIADFQAENPDIAVQAVLIILKHHLGDRIRVASDGTGPAWSDARRRVQASLGYGDDVEIEVTGYA